MESGCQRSSGSFKSSLQIHMLAATLWTRGSDYMICWTCATERPQRVHLPAPKYSGFCPYFEKDNISMKPFTCLIKMNIPLLHLFTNSCAHNQITVTKGGLHRWIFLPLSSSASKLQSPSVYNSLQLFSSFCIMLFSTLYFLLQCMRGEPPLMERVVLKDCAKNFRRSHRSFKNLLTERTKSPQDGAVADASCNSAVCRTPAVKPRFSECAAYISTERS